MMSVNTELGSHLQDSLLRSVLSSAVAEITSGVHVAVKWSEPSGSDGFGGLHDLCFNMMYLIVSLYNF